jgi:hypothetical protein
LTPFETSAFPTTFFFFFFSLENNQKKKKHSSDCTPENRKAPKLPIAIHSRTKSNISAIRTHRLNKSVKSKAIAIKLLKQTKKAPKYGALVIFYNKY